MSEVGHLEDEARKRREKLKNLKNRKADDTAGNQTESESATELPK
jgi:hypothetical protein